MDVSDLVYPEEVGRYQAVAAALDSSRIVIQATRRIAKVRGLPVAGGLALVGATQLARARRVGLLAASMNPLTRAHVALAESAKRSAKLDKLYWVATTAIVDKERVERATLADRVVQATCSARATGDGLLLLHAGLYVEQARAARTLAPPGAEMSLIVGYDKIVQIFDARYYHDRDAALRELFAEADLIVSPRQGHGEADLRALLAQPENRQFAHRVSFCSLSDRFGSDSSSEARAIAADDPADARLRDLLTPEGLALTTVTAAYVAERLPLAHDLGDVYTARQTLLAALGALPPSRLSAVPALSELGRISAEVGPRGAALRAWARSQRRPTFDGLMDALDQR